MKILEVKKFIKKECDKGKIVDWFFSTHLLGVEKNAKFLLSKLPKADKEVVMLGVWLHDLQRIRGLKGDHQKVSAREAKKVMKDFGYKTDVIKKVEEIILSHSCSSVMPISLEGKVLASADAMSHYYNNFYFKIACTGQRDFDEFKEWILEKLDRNYNKKIFFPFAKKEIRERHRLLKKLFNMN